MKKDRFAWYRSSCCLKCLENNECRHTVHSLQHNICVPKEHQLYVLDRVLQRNRNNKRYIYLYLYLCFSLYIYMSREGKKEILAFFKELPQYYGGWQVQTLPGRLAARDPGKSWCHSLSPDTVWGQFCLFYRGPWFVFI